MTASDDIWKALANRFGDVDVVRTKGCFTTANSMKLNQSPNMSRH